MTNHLFGIKDWAISGIRGSKFGGEGGWGNPMFGKHNIEQIKFSEEHAIGKQSRLHFIRGIHKSNTGIKYLYAEFGDQKL